MNDFPYNEQNLSLIRKVADELCGTCKSADDVIEEHFGEGVTLTDLDMLLLHELDDITMQCEGCGWWCETGELDDDQVCEDCR